MSENNNISQKTYLLRSIGEVRASEVKGSYSLQIFEPYRSALKQMKEFSHIIIIWWAD